MIQVASKKMFKVTCQSTLFKRGSVSPSSAHSLSIHAVKKEHSISITELILRKKNKRLQCIDKTLICICICHLYAHLCNAQHSLHNAKNSHLNITAGSIVQAVKLGKGSNMSIHTVQKGKYLSIFC